MHEGKNIWALHRDALPGVRRQLAALSASPARDGRPARPAARLASVRREDLPLQTEGDLALIEIVGPMMKDIGYYGFADTRLITYAFRIAATDAGIQRILLRIDSPGGSVDGLSDLGDAIWEARAKKPVIAHIDGMGASAAYYAASQATEIRAGRTDLVGSIGTYLVVDDLSEMYRNAGIETLVFATGPYKAAGVEGAEVTDAQREDFQREVDEYFAEFRSVVLRGRNLTGAQLDRVADGRTWMGPAAQSLNLIDRVMSFEETLRLESGSATLDRFRQQQRARAARAQLAQLESRQL